jgi:hypothetical protein
VLINIPIVARAGGQPRLTKNLARALLIVIAFGVLGVLVHKPLETLSVFPEQTVNLLHEFSAIIPAVKLRDIFAVQIYRLYGVILIGLSSFTMFRVYSAQL